MQSTALPSAPISRATPADDPEPPSATTWCAGGTLAAQTPKGYRLGVKALGGPMRALTILSLSLALVGTSAFAGDPYPFQRSDGKWGYVDDDHCWVIAPQFHYATAFSEDKAFVTTGLGVAYIDLIGKFVLGPPISNRTTAAGEFHDGLAKANYFTSEGTKWGFINTSGIVA
jgi:hypothetical protein